MVEKLIFKRIGYERMNWIIEEAHKVNPYKNVILLENPKVIKQLDERFLKKYKPFVKNVIWNQRRHKNP